MSSLEGDPTPAKGRLFSDSGTIVIAVQDTYRKSHAPDIDGVAPLDVQQRLRGSIHDRHDVAGVRARTQPRTTESSAGVTQSHGR